MGAQGTSGLEGPSPLWRARAFSRRTVPKPHVEDFLLSLKSQGVHPANLFGDRVTEWESISGERNPEMFAASLLSLADRLEGLGRIQQVAVLYQWVGTAPAATGIPETVKNLGRQRLERLAGGGSFGQKAEFFIGQLSREILQPLPLLSLGVGSLAYRGVRLWSLARMSRGVTAGLLANPFSRRTLAGLAGLAVEAPVVTLLNRELSPAGGAHPHGFFTEALSMAIGLGSLRLAGTASAPLARRLTLEGGATGRSLTRAVPSLSMFSAILGARFVETHLGLREKSPMGDVVVESLATLLHFQMVGHLSMRILGPGFSKWERALDAHAESINLSRPRETAMPAWDLVGVGTTGVKISARPPGYFMSSSIKQGPQLGMNFPTTPVESKGPAPTPAPPPIKRKDPEQITGKALLPRWGEQPELRFQGDLTQSTPDLALRTQVSQALQRYRPENLPSYLFALEGILRAQADKEGLPFDVWMGQALRQAGVEELAAGWRLVKKPKEKDASAEQEVLWLAAFRPEGAARRWGEIAGLSPGMGMRAVSGILEMGKAQRSEVLEVFSELLQSDNPMVAYPVILGAPKLGDPDLLPMLRRAYRKKDRTREFALREALVELGDQKLLPELHATLQHPRTDFVDKAMAATAVGLLGERQAAIEVLKTLVLSKRIPTRIAAARGLARLNAQGTIPSLKKLIEGWAAEDIRALASDFLKGGSREPAEYLARIALSRPDVGNGNPALQLIREADMTSLIPAVEAFPATTPYPELRRQALKTLAHLYGGAGETSKLEALLKYKEEPLAEENEPQRANRQRGMDGVRLEAAKALLSRGPDEKLRPKIQETLQSILTNPDETQQLEAAYLLRVHWDSPEAWRQLKYLSQSQRAEIRYRTAQIRSELEPDGEKSTRSFLFQLRNILLDYSPDKFSSRR